MPAVVVSNSRAMDGSFHIDNLSDDETVHQRCVLVHGRYSSAISVDEDFVLVSSDDTHGNLTFPVQSWPLADGRFKALVFLSPGKNRLIFHHSRSPEDEGDAITVTYLPLLNNAPLHLAIMLAKDSPLLIDCPPIKQGGLSSAHSSLDAAIAKLRMSAYMWQALTAEDMRAKGLGRRSFRLEEEWSADTTSQQFLHGLHESALYDSGAMRSTAKIHLIKSERTVAELRNANIAQQYSSKPFEYFLEALKAHGAQFQSSAHPVVAGMLLDSHYSTVYNLVLGHTALGIHNPKGMSLGVFGSHLTYSWPRFVEEASSCLLDTRNPGDTVENDNGKCSTLWEACSTGQGAFLHEVGQAFGASYKTTGVMARGYAEHWASNFQPRTAYSGYSNKEGFVVIDNETENDARWDLQDALLFRKLPHFGLLGDVQLPEDVRSSAPSVKAPDEWSESLRLVVNCVAGIARIQFNNETEAWPSLQYPPAYEIAYTIPELESRFDRMKRLKLQIMGLNGQEKTVWDVWRLFSRFIRIPGSNLVFQKQSITTKELEASDVDKGFREWATLLTHRQEDGKIKRATKVHLRTGLILDGAFVYFDNLRINCGHRKNTRKHYYGDRAAEAISIPAGQEIVKVQVSREWNRLLGLRMHLGNGEAKGDLSGLHLYDQEVYSLEPAAGQRIVGFFGRSYWGEQFHEQYDSLVEFGIITAPKGVELPEPIKNWILLRQKEGYTMPELQNTDRGIEIRERNKDDDDENERDEDDEN